MKEVFKRVLPIFMVLVCLAFVSCHKDENTNPNNNGGDGNEQPIDPNPTPNPDPNPDPEPDHPADNGYAKIRIEFSSNYKEFIDLRYYKIDISVYGECANATRQFNKRITESLAETPFVYETDFHYHGDVWMLVTFIPEMNGDLEDLLNDPNDILLMFNSIKLYVNDILVKNGDMGLTYTFPYAEF